MPTKLSRYAEGVMEAAWIAAIIMTPLFFNKYSSRIFEPDKATLLRTLALIILGAWIIKITENGLSKRDPDKSWKDNLLLILRDPIVPLVFALVCVYVLSTLLSVTPRISFWGSYQRLQGLYTTLAYIVVFAALVANLRKREQVERLITVAILTSLPVSLYGVLQKYGIDPIPWGGNVVRRIASHMGNSIFVAAYLIMVFPLTAVRIVESFSAILKEEQGLGRHIARSTIYIFIAALQLIAIYFSQSRGPLLGLLAGSFFLFILLSLYWRKRWLTFTMVGLGIVAGIFLFVFNLDGGPLESLKAHPSIGRYGRLLDTESNTAKVRTYIWEGAAELVAPHDPLEFPDGHSDPLNIIRPLIGYGPETMHMAYNPFYPPELAHVEKRNASPDRSHNETWDSLVFSGVLGLAAYLGLFAAVFYYGLKWLGLINSPKQKYVFFLLYFGAGAISAVGFYIWQGIAFLGVALPFGIILGLIGYLTLSAIFTKPSTEVSQHAPARSLTLIMMLSAIMAHFVEINFGIAIVSTRTYFFAYMAILLSVGFYLPKRDEYLITQTTEAQKQSIKPRRKGKQKYQKSGGDTGLWNRDIAIGSFIASLLLLPLFYEYIANTSGMTKTFEVLWFSLTRLDKETISYGVLALLLTTWLAASILFSAENGNSERSGWKSFLIILGVSGGIGLIYGIFLSGSLAGIVNNVKSILDQATAFEGLLTQFYTFMILILLVLGTYLPFEWPKRATNPSSFGIVVAPIVLVLVIALSYFSNWRVIQADVTFKLAEPYANQKNWEAAIFLYQRAKDHAPSEDYYDLFLGRGYLEQAKTVNDATEKQTIFEKAEADLKKAQTNNPLNPDHTANLARLYSWWALQTTGSEKQRRGLISDDYYSRVLKISPNNARLWNEWAVLQLDVIKQTDRALESLERSIEIDPEYDWTYALLGNLYFKIARETEDSLAKEEAFQKAIENYQKAIEVTPSLSYFYSLATIYQAMNDIESILTVLEEALPYAKNAKEITQTEETIAKTAFQIGRKAYALQHAKNALEAAPESDKDRIRQLIQQIEANP